MHLSKLVSDDEAVSPVIGVILMVAITVVLAAVIGTFVLGLGDDIRQTTPNASFQFEYDSSAGSLDIAHTGGDAIAADELYVVVDGSRSGWSGDTDADGNVKAGHTDTVSATQDSDVKVVWEDTGSDSSATLATWSG